MVAKSNILDAYGRPMASPRSQRWQQTRAQARQILARHDAAQTTDNNRRHWANADGLSASAAASPAVRQTLRNRCRYELQENNSLGKGIILTLAADTIGTGPRLQMLTNNRSANRAIELSFNLWGRRIRLAPKLRTMRISKLVDGEGVALKRTNLGVRHPVKLDLQLIECDQLATPTLSSPGRNAVDGIRFDDDGNPVEYHILDQHPGAGFASGSPHNRFHRVPAEFVIHYFREDRPGQRRGIPEMATALPLFAQLRRFVLATIEAAETAASFAGVMYTDSNALSADEIDDIEVMDAIELERRAMLTLPMGWKMGQVKAEHPATTFEMFRTALINDIARCISMPLNVAMGNSSGYNYASGRLDHMTYQKSIDVERSDLECTVLDPLLEAWLDEAIFVLPALFGAKLGLLDELPHRWFWDAHKHVDPLKEANAAVKLWDASLLSDDDYFFSEGIDPDEHYANLEKQYERRRKIGAPLPGDAASTSAAPGDAADDDDEANDGETEGGAEGETNQLLAPSS